MIDPSLLLAIEAMEATERFARRCFRSDEDRADAVSEAWFISRWECYTTPLSIARDAVRRIKWRRHIGRGVRSIDADFRCAKPSERKRWHERPQRSDWDNDINELASRDNPADLAILRIDFAEWRSLLTKRNRQVVDLLLKGWRSVDIARKLGLTEGRISQLRRSLGESLRDYLTD